LSNRIRKSMAVALVLVMVFAVGGLSACKSETETSSGSTGGTLAYYVGEPAYIDPYNTQESEGTQVEQSVFDSLTSFDPLDPATLVPAAAESWEANADATVWTFRLNKDGKFSDGTPVTASDFVYAWNRIASTQTMNTSTNQVEASSIAYHLAVIAGTDEFGNADAGISGLKAVDDYTLEVTLKNSFGDFGYLVGHPALAPVPKALVEGGVKYTDADGKEQTAAYGDMPVGNGPFKLSEPWKRNQYIKVVQNENYYGEKPLIDGIDFLSFKDPNTAFTEFEAGTLDFTQIGEGRIKDAEAKYGVSTNGYTANPGEQVLLGAENSIYYLVVNNTIKPMDQAAMRSAVSLAINRQAICDNVFEGTREPADNVVPPGIAGYAAGVWADAKYDVEGAKAALTEAGFPGGEGAPEIALSYNADGGHQKIMEYVKADLEAIGLTVKLNPTPDFATYLKELDADKIMIGRLGWSADYPIMDNFMFPLFKSGSTDNYSRYADSAVDAAMQAARANPDDAARLAAWQEVNKTVGAGLPVIPVMFYKHHHVASERVHDLTYSAMNLADFTKVWLDPK